MRRVGVAAVDVRVRFRSRVSRSTAGRIDGVCSGSVVSAGGEACTNNWSRLKMRSAVLPLGDGVVGSSARADRAVNNGPGGVRKSNERVRVRSLSAAETTHVSRGVRSEATMLEAVDEGRRGEWRPSSGCEVEDATDEEVAIMQRVRTGAGPRRACLKGQGAEYRMSVREERR